MPKRKPDDASLTVGRIVLAYQKMVIDFKRTTESIVKHDELLDNDLFYESVVDAHDCAAAALRKIAEHSEERKKR